MTNWRQTTTTLDLLREIAAFIREWEDDKMAPADYEAKNHLSNLVNRVIAVEGGPDARPCMRKLVINRLAEIIADSDGQGIPSEFDCDEDQMIHSLEELEAMDNDALLAAFEATIGFTG